MKHDYTAVLSNYLKLIKELVVAHSNFHYRDKFDNINIIKYNYIAIINDNLFGGIILTRSKAPTRL